MRIVSLTTDFGIGDFEIGSMCGVILNLAPDTKIADLTHAIPPQNVLDAAVILSRHFYYFPPDSIHVVVVDPGVGTDRRPLAALIKDQIYVGPDNGIITLVYQEAIRNNWQSRFIHTNNEKYWLKDVSHIFHGRDVFAAVAGHLSAGIEIFDLGDEIFDPILLDLPEPVIDENTIKGIVLRADHFGNLETNIDQSILPGKGKLIVTIEGHEIIDLVNTFGDSETGDLVSMIDSSGQLSICVVNGSAKEKLGIDSGTAVEVRVSD